ncbi:MAG: tryptophan synthase subunit alpha [Methanosarcinales archaeon]|uniref:Tryptophan synthase alpha chain n=1 Tax=Candidatus Ethanoperedens thermophilum TaxID=2766897 RepID=A0A848D5Y0_9EURY|nr:tryptophan synthase subunit alpha [Candidatus Ethanoperedens thermophilum]
MKHIADAFKHDKALIAYICAGDPVPDATTQIVHALIRAGADLIELGLPFSDPIADGPTIQAASQRSLRAGMNPDLFFDLVKTLPQTVPYAVMTYYNLIFHRGIMTFAKDCRNHGIGGIIVPDLPPEEADELQEACKKYNLDLIHFIAPTTTPERIERIIQSSSGFIYLVARLGVTGAREALEDRTKSLIQRVHTDIPKAVGFGISNPQQAKEIINAGADGVIVGSAIVDIIARNTDDINKAIKEIETLTRKLKEGITE